MPAWWLGLTLQPCQGVSGARVLEACVCDHGRMVKVAAAAGGTGASACLTEAKAKARVTVNYAETGGEVPSSDDEAPAPATAKSAAAADAGACPSHCPSTVHSSKAPWRFVHLRGC